MNKTLRRVFELSEASYAGYSLNHLQKFLVKNGYENVGNGKHPKYKHSLTGHTITSVNSHKGDVGADALRRIDREVKSHHQQKNLPYNGM